MLQTALLIVDVQNDFLKPEGKYYVRPDRAFIPNVKRLLEAARKNGVPVIFTQDTQMDDPEYSNDVEWNGAHCIKGTWGWQIVDELSPRDDERVVKKREYSGMYRTSLDMILKASGIRHLVVAGATTNCCVRATIQDAFERGYSISVPRECVVSATKRENESNLKDIKTFFGKVVPMKEAISTFSKN